MKTLDKLNTIIFIDITMLIISITSLFVVTNINISNINKPKYPITIDLPEEYKAISTDINNKDILQSYIKNDTLFIEFKH